MFGDSAMQVRGGVPECGQLIKRGAPLPRLGCVSMSAAMQLSFRPWQRSVDHAPRRGGIQTTPPVPVAIAELVGGDRRHGCGSP